MYADKFPTFATQSDGMAQHIVWTALRAEGLAGNLQHYNPLIDASVQKFWGVPEDWELSAQLVFGVADGGDMAKEFSDVSQRVWVRGA